MSAYNARPCDWGTCCAVCELGRVSVHGCNREWLGVRCHSMLGVLHVQGHACAVQLMGRGGLLAGAAGVSAVDLSALTEHKHRTRTCVAS